MRKAVCLEQQLAKGRLSKKRKEALTVTPIILGSGKIEMPPEIKDSPIALAKWKELSKLFNKTDYITSADSGIISQYCLLHADIAELRTFLTSPEARGDIKLSLSIHGKINNKT